MRGSKRLTLSFLVLDLFIHLVSSYTAFALEKFCSLFTTLSCQSEAIKRRNVPDRKKSEINNRRQVPCLNIFAAVREGFPILFVDRSGSDDHFLAQERAGGRETLGERLIFTIRVLSDFFRILGCQ